MLRAKGIPYVLGQRRELHSIWVNETAFPAAFGELRSYESENANWPPPPELAPAHAPYAFQGSVLFAAALILMHLLATGSALGLDWMSAGQAAASQILGGEPWRAMTALFLHADVPHLLSNLIFGLFFGYLVAIGHGGGLGYFTILLGGWLGNLGNALIQAPEHLSIGASTAVFSALGVLAGSEWQRRNLMRQTTLRRAAPVVLALTAFAMHGVPREVGNVDVGAHAMGLLAGFLLGVPLPWMMGLGLAKKPFQWCWGLLSGLLVGISWWLALSP